jgi:4-hydroxy-2-oxoglutarate aldolase
MKKFAGMFTPIVTPFRRDDTVDLDALRRNVDRWMRTPLTGLVVLGSTGEAALLDEDESDRAVEAVRERMPSDRPLIAGTGRESTRATIEATRRAASLGADAVMVRTPAFFKPQMTSELFVAHYTRVADSAPVPVLLYNVTMFTGVNLLPDAVERLASHPNIAGIKESGGDIGAIADLVSRTPDGFTVLAGSATTFFHALCAGCDGGVLALAALVPDRCVELQSLVAQGRLAEARQLQRDLLPLARLIGGVHGVPALKAALDLAGYEGGLPRPPLLPAGAGVLDALRRERMQRATAVSA